MTAATRIAPDDFDPTAWIAAHPITTVCLAGLWLWISGALIIRVWTAHAAASLPRKVGWSFVLLVPIFGWLFYGGLFQIPGVHPNPPTGDYAPFDAGGVY